MPRIAYLGHGRMGRLTEEVARERGHTTAFIVGAATELGALDWSRADVAIDFSQPAVAERLCTLAIEAGVPLVSGTTGWDIDGVRARVLAKAGGAFLHATNMSVGVNVAFAANALIARLLGQAGGYTVAIEETHHVHKRDTPSGTAVTLAEGVRGGIGGEVPIRSLREGEVFGDHEVAYTSAVDTLSLKHHARSRRGFALGAVLAAEFVVGRSGVFSMRDVLGLP